MQKHAWGAVNIMHSQVGGWRNDSIILSSNASHNRKLNNFAKKSYNPSLRNHTTHHHILSLKLSWVPVLYVYTVPINWNESITRKPSIDDPWNSQDVIDSMQQVTLYMHQKCCHLQLNIYTQINGHATFMNKMHSWVHVFRQLNLVPNFYHMQKHTT